MPNDSTFGPGAGTYDEPGWLSEAAAAAVEIRNLKAGMSPLDIAHGSVAGFDVAQAQAILEHGNLLAQLVQHWTAQGIPSRVIHRIAIQDDIRGRLHQQLLEA